MTRFIYLLLGILSVLSCSNSNETFDDNEDVNEVKRPNILLVIADDMGLDASPGYNIGDTKPNMPNLQNMINSGITFNNVWANPTCSPTRASILTGKYGFRTGVLDPGDVLSTNEMALQPFIDSKTNSTYNHAVIGKWHLSNSASHPNDMGINHFAGISGGGVSSYYTWSLNENGQTTTSSDYITSKFTDLAIDWVGEQNQPWFLWLAYNAPHTPFHLPPNNLHSQGSLPSDESSIDANPLPYYLAALEALDTEFGRLLNAMSDEDRANTIIIFIGDNGTPNQVAQEYPIRRVKGSIYQGGVNVPMVVSGQGVSRINASEDALINATDLFATIADIAGSGTTEVNDSKSFKPLLSDTNAEKRSFVYTENEDISIRNETHKYIYFEGGIEGLYNLNNTFYEDDNLLNSNLSSADEAIKNELTLKLQSLRD